VKKKSKIEPILKIMNKEGGRMNRKLLSILGVGLLILTFTSCSSSPEQSLLDRYFAALSMKDNATLSTMAMSPMSFDFTSWEILSVSEEVVQPFALSEMNTKELELKKKVEESVGITLDSRADLDEAIFEKNNARTGAARRAAQTKVDEMQTAYDEQRAAHAQLQKEYNIAKEAAAKEEDIAAFSLGSDYPTIRDFVGEVSSKEVDVQVTGKEGTGSYKFFLKRYTLEDESMSLSHRGRWIIEKVQKIG
jgi:hypothetical protein